MSHNLTPGRYQVVSLASAVGGAVGIDPSRPASQPVRVSGRIQDWNLQSDGETILLRIGGYPVTQVVNGIVTVSSLPGPGQRWRATYREAQDAYTIASDQLDGFLGWTVVEPGVPGSEIEIRPIIEMPSLPPRFITSQLYRFVRLRE